jgi:hypothetical protein
MEDEPDGYNAALLALKRLNAKRTELPQTTMIRYLLDLGY